MVESPELLLAEAKTYLDMTWEDEAADNELFGILLRGMSYLDHAAGIPLDYGDGTAARALLFDYARYVRAGALQDFGKDFASELLGLHIAGEVEQVDRIQRRGGDHLCCGKQCCPWKEAGGCSDQEGASPVSAKDCGHPAALCRAECRGQGGPAAAGPVPPGGVHPGCSRAHAGREAVPDHLYAGPGGHHAAGDGSDAGAIGERL